MHTHRQYTHSKAARYGTHRAGDTYRGSRGEQPQRYPTRIDLSTPMGAKSIEWKALCLQLGVSKAKALLRSWEKAKGSTKAGLGTFVHSNTYGCMDYWEVTNVHYRDSLVRSDKKTVEATWSLVKKALLYKLF